MSLKEVRIGEEVWLTCLSHALTTETEEVMGLLLGDVEVLPLTLQALLKPLLLPSRMSRFAF
jgi:BRCA1/BRCA2-containing complex subunit 3